MLGRLPELELTTSTPSPESIAPLLPERYRPVLASFYDQMSFHNQAPSPAFRQPGVALSYAPEVYSNSPTAVLMHSALAMSKLVLETLPRIIDSDKAGRVRAGLGIGMANLMELLVDMSQGKVDWQGINYRHGGEFQHPNLIMQVRGSNGKRAQTIYEVWRKDLIIHCQQIIRDRMGSFYRDLESGSSINSHLKIFMLGRMGEPKDIKLRYKFWTSGGNDYNSLTQELFGQDLVFNIATANPEQCLPLQRELMDGLNIGNLQLDGVQAQILETRGSLGTPSAIDSRFLLDDVGA
jgi:hypothetical protein